jgi:hypothetical protein
MSTPKLNIRTPATNKRDATCIGQANHHAVHNDIWGNLARLKSSDLPGNFSCTEFSEVCI